MWKLLHSILPTGGFAHSFGLEAAMQARIISCPEDIQSYVIYVLENIGSLLLPFVYSSTMSHTLETWHRLNRMLDATLTNEVGRKASIAQGSTLMRVAAAVFSKVPSLKAARDAILGSGFPQHYAPIFGLISGLLGLLNSGTSQRAYLFIIMRDVISDATSLNLVGPLGAAVLQHQVAHVAEDLSKKRMNHVVEEAYARQLLCLIQFKAAMATYFLAVYFLKAYIYNKDCVPLHFPLCLCHAINKDIDLPCHNDKQGEDGMSNMLIKSS